MPLATAPQITPPAPGARLTAAWGRTWARAAAAAPLWLGAACLALTLAGAPGRAAAGSPATAGAETLSLGQCITQAVAASQQVGQTTELKVWEEAKEDASFRRLFPKVSVDLYHQPKVDFFGQPVEDQDLYTSEMKVTQPVWAGGALDLARERDAKGVAKADLQRNKAALEAALAVVPVYYEELTARRLGARQVELGRLAGDEVATAQRGLDLGRLRREDLLAAQARQAEIRYDQVRYQSQAREAAHHLNELMGYSREARFTTVPQAPLYNPPSQAEDLLQQALEHNAALGFARAEATYREVSFRHAKALDNSRVNLVGRFGLEGDTFPGPEKNAALMLVWELPIGDNSVKAFYEHERLFQNDYAFYFQEHDLRRKGLQFSFLDGSSKEPDIAERAYELRKAKGELADNLNQLKTKVFSLWEELRRQSELLELARQEEDLSRERVAVARARQAAGAEKPEEVLKREMDLARSQARALEAQCGRWRVLATMCLLSGGDLRLREVGEDEL
ncbi:MAG: TolC family protein [Deltaproteobacteria bacterium]|nr:TolC family protein [Deltaproteobacteria bacterium]